MTAFCAGASCSLHRLGIKKHGRPSVCTECAAKRPCLPSTTRLPTRATTASTGPASLPASTVQCSSAGHRPAATTVRPRTPSAGLPPTTPGVCPTTPGVRPTTPGVCPTTPGICTPTPAVRRPTPGVRSPARPAGISTGTTDYCGSGAAAAHYCSGTAEESERGEPLSALHHHAVLLAVGVRLDRLVYDGRRLKKHRLSTVTEGQTPSLLFSKTKSV